MDSKLIFYCSGGIGNRLCPMLNIKDIFTEDIYIVWEKTVRLNCEFHDLFDNENIKVIKENDLPSISNVSNFHGIKGGLEPSIYEYNVYKNKGLLDVSKKYPPQPLSKYVHKNDKYKNVIIFSNNIIGAPNPKIIKENFNMLRPKKHISDKINTIVGELNINKDVLGVHARGMDFSGQNLEYYFKMVESEIKTNPKQKIFFCSDDNTWESSIKQKYPDNIIIRSQKDNVYKIDKTKPYSYNIAGPLEAIIDGYIDIILLSKTNLKYFNERSSFGKLSNFIK